MTMSISRSQLTQEILEFMKEIHECYSNTSYANDRTVYAQDLMEAMGWIVSLQSGEGTEDVIAKIKSPETEKHFSDYWRQGDWGKQEAIALKKLKDRLRVLGN
jgi:hypothetical protein